MKKKNGNDNLSSGLGTTSAVPAQQIHHFTVQTSETSQLEHYLLKTCLKPPPYHIYTTLRVPG